MECEALCDVDVGGRSRWDRSTQGMEELKVEQAAVEPPLCRSTNISSYAAGVHAHRYDATETTENIPTGLM